MTRSNSQHLPAYGIDLGTTNSLIARHVGGKVEIVRNPRGFREVFPSAVAYQGNRVLVGDRAINLMEKSPEKVFTGFKRRIGTTETYPLPESHGDVTPVELSAEVLKNMRSTAEQVTGDLIEAVVITVPAAFDLPQSEATRQAGVMAGFERIDLIQEPVAASLAYANNTSLQRQEGDQWLVYDLGGGTLDISLVRIVDGEMCVVDHEGDNYLGGRDFDHRLVTELIVPRLGEMTSASGLSTMHCSSNPYHSLYRRLLMLAETAKAELSTLQETEIEADLDVNGEEIPFAMTVSRPQFEFIIMPTVDMTIRMMGELLGRNGLSPSAIKFVLYVGGATYTPFVRRRIETKLGISSASDIDPTNAVVIGAAWYASAVHSRVPRPARQDQQAGDIIEVKLSYPKTSKADSELLAGKVQRQVSKCHYRITGSTMDFDSGLKPLDPKFYETLPLAPDSLNVFTLALYGTDGQSLPVHPSDIRIAQGMYRIEGQPLSHDICLEVDDLLAEASRLDVIFAKNTLLPARKTVRRTLSKSVRTGSDDTVDINVYEGEADAGVSENLCIGQIRISGREISKFVMKGCPIDLSFEMSDNRELSVSARIPDAGLEYSEVFKAGNRHVDPAELAARIKEQHVELKRLLANYAGDTIAREELGEMINESEALLLDVGKLKMDDTTDAKFQIDDRRRRLGRRIGRTFANQDLFAARLEYQNKMHTCIDIVSRHGTDDERGKLAALVEKHRPTVRGVNVPRIRAATEELCEVAGPVNARRPGFPVDLFNWLTTRSSEFQDGEKARRLIDKGMKAHQAGDTATLVGVNNQLWNLLPQPDRERFNQDNLKGIA